MLQTTNERTTSTKRSALRHPTRRTPVLILRTVVILALLACSLSAQAGAPQNPVSRAAVKVRHWLQVGQASWYGRSVQGRRTASGERFDMNAMTCAHRTLPLGSWLRVTNLGNQRSVLVRVTDRGPFSHSRVVDLSFAAAHAVGITGLGEVKLEPVNASDPEIAALIAAKIAETTVAPEMAMRFR